ncbi:hypothetical protein [Mucilaginibacter polytrichastri]|uniref:Uncharacterized protein n=1 Tax=Mucilaginibacter polytrichastri TaxID=1302689 RepID=A0A1Q6A465_9SPHI|nr:hypothetical protein [Mucilaginibacter polytrichastri]OKS88787.1 hypothetical protein RG47T_4265 [Mucilaginibacter polytrichastri]SFT05657.1 hypothetical protein SAMN04487890_109119 [Mucilaginibacter polytrichastri]
MTWIKFISWLTGLYFFYYVLNMAWDLMRSRHAGTKEAAPELHFEEAVAPTLVAPAALENKSALPTKKSTTDVAASALGGVNVKDLFQLARLELIAYNQSVTF